MEEERFCPLEIGPCLPGVAIESLEDIIYVSDLQTYDVLWLNPIGLRRFGVKNVRGYKCYQLFQGEAAPCPFCPLDRLSFDSFYVWEHANPVTGQYFLVKDKLISWRGRVLHMEVAVDITEQAAQRQAAQRKFEVERTLVECVRILLREEKLSSAIDMVLARAGEQYGAERCYVFEFGQDAAGNPVASNTHEWCAPGVEPQQSFLQNQPLGVAGPWIELFRKRQDVIIENLEDIRDLYPDVYAILARQDIQRLFAVPLSAGDALTGFIGVDNPRIDLRNFTLLHSLAYFVDNEITKRRMAEELRQLGLRDALTGLGNRSAYLSACGRIGAGQTEKLGVVFVDLNDLKHINDFLGHKQGDEYIRSLSEVFLHHFRNREIFRIGGDEFVFLCENIPENLFHAKIEALLREGEERFSGTIALGAVWSPLATDVDSLVREADRRMYAEKQRQKAAREANGEEHPCNRRF